MLKWFFAILGAIFFRYIGAILGFVLGSISDNLISGFKEKNTTGERMLSPKDFELNLLTLSSIIIQADGVVNKTELLYVRNYFIDAFGKEFANTAFRTFNEIIKTRSVSPLRICNYIYARTTYEARLQIVHFLFGIANADGQISPSEMEEIRKISSFFRIHFKDYESIQAMFLKSEDQSYTILEIEKSATDAELKKAFRTMAKKYHPDKIQHLDAVYKKGAEEKFRAVQEAYEKIKKERGLP